VFGVRHPKVVILDYLEYIMTSEIISGAFESVGIPKMQTMVYLDLLKHKDSTATQISKRTKMHRANVYDTLTKLKEKNLVYSSNKESKKSLRRKL